MQDTAVLQRFLAQFPKRIIREKISKNKEFLDGIREFDLQNFKFGVARIPPHIATGRRLYRAIV